MVYFYFGSDIMTDYHYLIIVGCSFVIFAIIHKIGKNKKPVRRAFLSLITGFVSLIAINISSIFTGVSLPFSMLTIVVSLVGGIPGVTTLLGLNLFF